ncbi:MAG TPA: alpha/beta hydrolase [Fontimonas sp.]
MATFSNGDATLYYEVHGEGRPVVLIHGLGSSAMDWEYQLPALRHYKVIAVDLRGHGRSSRAPVPISMSLFADDIAALLRHLQIDAAHIVGLSLGGGIAFQFALDHPQAVRSMVIVNSGPHAVLETFASRLVIRLRFVIIRLFGLPRLAKVVARKLFPKPEHAQKMQMFVERFGGNDVDSYRASLRALLGWSVQHRLGEIAAPTLVLTADQDYTPVRWKEDYVARMPRATLRVIADSHHALPVENPQPFNAALVEFLDAH